MKKFIFPLLLILWCLSCNKDASTISNSLEERGTGDKVTLCHKNGTGNFQPITIAKSAVAAHIVHGDYNPDADGDGHTAPGSCTGDGLDCDDHDASVWNTCCGSCGLPSNAIFDCAQLVGYASSMDCEVFGLNGYFLGGENALIFVVEFEGVHFIGYIYNDKQCFLTVEGVEGSTQITLAEWESALAFVQTYIQNHPDLINLCGEPTFTDKSNHLKAMNKKLQLSKDNINLKLKPILNQLKTTRIHSDH